MEPPEGLEGLEILEGYARFRPSGSVTFAQAVGQARAAIAYCREQGVRRLLLDSRNLSGFAPPEMMERVDMGAALAEAAKGAVKVAMVARAEMIDPRKIGMVFGRNRGLFGEVFETEEEALAWLLDTKAR